MSFLLFSPYFTVRELAKKSLFLYNMNTVRKSGILRVGVPDGRRIFRIGEKMAETIKDLPGGNETILIVDDHETIWDFLIEALQCLGYSVLLAENGADAVEIYRENPGQVDLVLLDMIMPKVGGHQAFCQIRAMDPEATILLSSGFVSEEEVHDLLQQGACGFLPKPHRLPDVARAIRKALDRKTVKAC